MRILGIILAAAIVGTLVGGAVAYVEVRSDVDPVNELPGELQVAARASNEGAAQGRSGRAAF